MRMCNGVWIDVEKGEEKKDEDEMVTASDGNSSYHGNVFDKWLIW